MLEQTPGISNTAERRKPGQPLVPRFSLLGWRLQSDQHRVTLVGYSRRVTTVREYISWSKRHRCLARNGAWFLRLPTASNAQSPEGLAGELPFGPAHPTASARRSSGNAWRADGPNARVWAGPNHCPPWRDSGGGDQQRGLGGGTGDAVWSNGQDGIGLCQIAVGGMTQRLIF